MVGPVQNRTWAHPSLVCKSLEVDWTQPADAVVGGILGGGIAGMVAWQQLRAENSRSVWVSDPDLEAEYVTGCVRGTARDDRDRGHPGPEHPVRLPAWEILGLIAARVRESVADDSDFKTLIFTGLFEDRR